MSRRFLDNRAVALAELLFALLFIAMAVLAVVGVQIFSVKARHTSDQRHQASLIAASIMWQAVESSRQDFTASVSIPPGTRVGPPLDSTERFTYAVDEPPPQAPLDSSQLRQIRVTVSWQSQTGPQSLVVTTKVTPP